MTTPATGTGGFGVAVVGLKDLQRDLRRVDRELPKAISRVHREIAREGRDRARSKAQRRKGRHRFARLIGSSGNQSAAVIKYAASKHPAAMGWLFGSKRYRQFGQWVGNRYTNPGQPQPTYAIQPAIKELEPSWAKLYLERITEALRGVWS